MVDAAMNPWTATLTAMMGALAMASCADPIPPSTFLVDGAAATPPAGWVGYCSRHAEDSGCR
jgi:hypothetical protein